MDLRLFPLQIYDISANSLSSIVPFSFISVPKRSKIPLIRSKQTYYTFPIKSECGKEQAAEGNNGWMRMETELTAEGNRAGCVDEYQRWYSPIHQDVSSGKP